MNDPLRQHIATVRAQPGSTEKLREHLSQISAVNPDAIEQYEQALNQAIDAIPAIIEQLTVAGQQAGTGHLLTPIVQQLTQYFLFPDDLVPDHQGTLGLLDDAYLAHAYLYQINVAYQASTGQLLLPVDPSYTLQVLSAILGQQITSQLDQAVVQDVATAVQQSQYQQLIQSNQSLGVTGGPGSWGGTWEDEMSRMGAEMGISINW